MVISAKIQWSSLSTAARPADLLSGGRLRRAVVWAAHRQEAAAAAVPDSNSDMTPVPAGKSPASSPKPPPPFPHPTPPHVLPRQHMQTSNTVAEYIVGSAAFTVV